MKTFTYTVEVEDASTPLRSGGDEGSARMVTETLGNLKSWTQPAKFAFQRIDASSPGKPDRRPWMTVREVRYEIPLESSCFNLVHGPDAQPRYSSTRPAGCGGGAVPGDIDPTAST
ncbi:MAG: DUF3152 domain-containing protein [Mycolicibacterium sp.]|nr:DUF3152 domain-containing protein [Mycolicibacterium sp.]